MGTVRERAYLKLQCDLASQCAPSSPLVEATARLIMNSCNIVGHTQRGWAWAAEFKVVLMVTAI